MKRYLVHRTVTRIGRDGLAYTDEDGALYYGHSIRVAAEVFVRALPREVALDALILDDDPGGSLVDDAVRAIEQRHGLRIATSFRQDGATYYVSVEELGRSSGAAYQA